MLLGHFNPLIFRPEWFAKNGLMGQKEADDATIELMHHDIAIFSFDWGKIEIQAERFAITSLESVDPRIHDLVVKTFKEFLPHTPIGRMGMNLKMDFPVKDVDTLCQIGERLAPKDPWGDWAGALKREEDDDKRSGLKTLTMQQSTRDDGCNGHIQATVQPSTLIAPAPGIRVGINDHIEVEDWANVIGCEEIVTKLESDWEISIDNARMIAQQVMNLA